MLGGTHVWISYLYSTTYDRSLNILYVLYPLCFARPLHILSSSTHILSTSPPLPTSSPSDEHTKHKSRITPMWIPYASNRKTCHCNCEMAHPCTVYFCGFLKSVCYLFDNIQFILWLGKKETNAHNTRIWLNILV